MYVEIIAKTISIKVNMAEVMMAKMIMAEVIGNPMTSSRLRGLPDEH